MLWQVECCASYGKSYRCPNTTSTSTSNQHQQACVYADNVSNVIRAFVLRGIDKSILKIVPSTSRAFILKSISTWHAF